tara:strand:+ start:131 stop:292 length:162 start_codon:yes stop_codon:yes gene_type:complete
MKLSKAAKMRLKRMSQAEKKSVIKAAYMLADAELITAARAQAIHRTCKGSMSY